MQSCPAHDYFSATEAIYSNEKIFQTKNEEYNYLCYLNIRQGYFPHQINIGIGPSINRLNKLTTIYKDLSVE